MRAGRVLLETLDPDAPSGTGAVALDLSSKKSVAKLVDEIPRLAVQTDRTFGTLSQPSCNMTNQPLACLMD